MPSTIARTLISTAAGAAASGAAFGHPSLDLPVTEEQRDRSLAYLQQAYAERRLTEYELDQRVETVLTARTRREMNRAFTGLAHVPMGTGALLAPRRSPGAATALGRAGGAVAHMSGLATWAVGPAVAYALAPQGSHLRREAAKAFNFQVVAGLAALLAGWATHGFLGWVVMSLGTVVWVLLTLAGAAHAAAGDRWQNPVTRLVPLQLLDEERVPARHRKALAPGWSRS